MAIHFRSIERRRTARAVMCINVLVYGKTPDGEKFRFWTRTTSVSGYGGALELPLALEVGQLFEVMNENNLKKAWGRVVSTRRAKKGLGTAAFEFVDSGAGFWSMSFPAANARPMRRFTAKPGISN